MGKGKGRVGTASIGGLGGSGGECVDKEGDSKEHYSCTHKPKHLHRHGE